MDSRHLRHLREDAREMPGIVRDSFSNRSVVPPVFIRFAVSMFRTAFPKDKRSLT